MTTLESVTMALSTLAALVAVLLAAWFILKWMGKRMPGQTSSRHIKILDRVVLGQDKCLLLVRVAGKAMLIGMTSGAATKLCDVDEDGLEPDAPLPSAQSFSSVFQSFLAKNKTSAPGEKQGRGEAEQ